MERNITEKAIIEIWEGDITQLEVDAIVNAANTKLWLGTGVAGAIRTRGGPIIQKQCNEILQKYPIKEIPLGEAAITSGGELKAKWVIHAASMGSGVLTTSISLEDSTKSSLLRVEEKQIKSMAFPAIGTGVAGFSMRECANIMLRAVSHHMRYFENSSLKRVVFALFDRESTIIFEKVLSGI